MATLQRGRELMTTLEQTRELDGATLLDDEGRYYRVGEEEGARHYGYSLHFTGAYVCYTCGHICDCGGDE
jgi:hypothetical protein